MKKKITQLKPDENNFNKHTEFGMHLLEKSMSKFGFVEAGVISEDGVIVSGNARQETAVNIGIEDVEIIKTDGKKAVYLQIEGLQSGTKEFHEMALALNAVPQKNIEFDFNVMAEFPEIDFGDWGIDFDFDTSPVEEDESAVAETISKAKELQEKWQMASGQLWALGEHRLLCGDSTKKEDVERLMQGEKAELLLTDPPYGIGIANNPVRQAHDKQNWDDKVTDTADLLMQISLVKFALIWGGNYFGLPASQGFFVWDKKQPEDFSLAMCEYAWTNKQSPAKMFRQSVLSYSKDHPTQKPTELFVWCIEQFEDTQIVLDTYAGSGTTLIACEQLNRKCRAIEISAEYVAVCLERWANLTNQTPELIKT